MVAGWWRLYSIQPERVSIGMLQVSVSSHPVSADGGILRVNDADTSGGAGSSGRSRSAVIPGSTGASKRQTEKQHLRKKELAKLRQRRCRADKRGQLVKALPGAAPVTVAPVVRLPAVEIAGGGGGASPLAASGMVYSWQPVGEVVAPPFRLYDDTEIRQLANYVELGTSLNDTVLLNGCYVHCATPALVKASRMLSDMQRLRFLGCVSRRRKNISDVSIQEQADIMSTFWGETRHPVVGVESVARLVRQMLLFGAVLDWLPALVLVKFSDAPEFFGESADYFDFLERLYKTGEAQDPKFENLYSRLENQGFALQRAPAIVAVLQVKRVIDGDGFEAVVVNAVVNALSTPSVFSEGSSLSFEVGAPVKVRIGQVDAPEFIQGRPYQKSLDVLTELLKRATAGPGPDSGEEYRRVLLFNLFGATSYDRIWADRLFVLPDDNSAVDFVREIFNKARDRQQCGRVEDKVPAVEHSLQRAILKSGAAIRCRFSHIPELNALDVANKNDALAEMRFYHAGGGVPSPSSEFWKYVDIAHGFSSEWNAWITPLPVLGQPPHVGRNGCDQRTISDLRKYFINTVCRQRQYWGCNDKVHSAGEWAHAMLTRLGWLIGQIHSITSDVVWLEERVAEAIRRVDHVRQCVSKQAREDATRMQEENNKVMDTGIDMGGSTRPTTTTSSPSTTASDAAATSGTSSSAYSMAASSAAGASVSTVARRGISSAASTRWTRSSTRSSLASLGAYPPMLGLEYNKLAAILTRAENVLVRIKKDVEDKLTRKRLLQVATSIVSLTHAPNVASIAADASAIDQAIDQLRPLEVVVGGMLKNIAEIFDSVRMEVFATAFIPRDLLGIRPPSTDGVTIREAIGAASQTRRRSVHLSGKRRRILQGISTSNTGTTSNGDASISISSVVDRLVVGRTPLMMMGKAYVPPLDRRDAGGGGGVSEEGASLRKFAELRERLADEQKNIIHLEMCAVGAKANMERSIRSVTDLDIDIMRLEGDARRSVTMPLAVGPSRAVPALQRRLDAEDSTSNDSGESSSTDDEDEARGDSHSDDMDNLSVDDTCDDSHRFFRGVEGAARALVQVSAREVEVGKEEDESDAGEDEDERTNALEAEEDEDEREDEGAGAEDQADQASGGRIVRRRLTERGAGIVAQQNNRTNKHAEAGTRRQDEEFGDTVRMIKRLNNRKRLLKRDVEATRGVLNGLCLDIDGCNGRIGALSREREDMWLAQSRDARGAVKNAIRLV